MRFLLIGPRHGVCPDRGAPPFSDLKAIGAGIVTLGPRSGIGMLAKGAFESMARQPEIEANIRTAMIIAAALDRRFHFFALAIIILQVIRGSMTVKCRNSVSRFPPKICGVSRGLACSGGRGWPGSLDSRRRTLCRQPTLNLD